MAHLADLGLSAGDVQSAHALDPFQQLLPTATPRLTGTGEPGQVVTLEAGGRTYRTAVGADGKYAFHAPTIPAGAALVSVAGAAATPVSIEPAD